jgi:hypothetical protein
LISSAGIRSLLFMGFSGTALRYSAALTLGIPGVAAGPAAGDDGDRLE